MASPQRDHTANVHLHLRDARMRTQERDDAQRAVLAAQEKERFLSSEVGNNSSQMAREQKLYDEACSRGAMVEAAQHAEKARVWEKTLADHSADLEVARAVLDAAKKRLADAEAAL